MVVDKESMEITLRGVLTGNRMENDLLKAYIDDIVAGIRSMDDQIKSMVTARAGPELKIRRDEGVPLRKKLRRVEGVPSSTSMVTARAGPELKIRRVVSTKMVTARAGPMCMIRRNVSTKMVTIRFGPMCKIRRDEGVPLCKKHMTRFGPEYKKHRVTTRFGPECKKHRVTTRFGPECKKHNSCAFHKCRETLAAGFANENMIPPITIAKGEIGDITLLIKKRRNPRAVGRCQETVTVGYTGFGHLSSEQNVKDVLIKKRRNPSAVGRCQEAVTVGYTGFGHVGSEQNPSDVLTKSLSPRKVYGSAGPILYNRFDQRITREFDARSHGGIEASPSRSNILSQIYIFSDERINQSPDSTPTTVRGVAVRYWLTRFYGG